VDTGQSIPRYFIRAHLHQFIKAEYEGKHGKITGVVVPSFQAKTGYVYKKIGYRIAQPDIGLCWIVIESDGSSELKWSRIEVIQDEVSEL
jgi:hypothetical protein